MRRKSEVRAYFRSRKGERLFNPENTTACYNCHDATAVRPRWNAGQRRLMPRRPRMLHARDLNFGPESGPYRGESIHRAKPASGHCGKRETFQRFRILLRYCGCFRAALAVSESRAYRRNAAEISSASVSSAHVSMCACPDSIIATLSSGAERSRVRMRICLTT
jgi:hypothetical protein